MPTWRVSVSVCITCEWKNSLVDPPIFKDRLLRNITTVATPFAVASIVALGLVLLAFSGQTPTENNAYQGGALPGHNATTFAPTPSDGDTFPTFTTLANPKRFNQAFAATALTVHTPSGLAPAFPILSEGAFTGHNATTFVPTPSDGDTFPTFTTLANPKRFNQAFAATALTVHTPSGLAPAFPILSEGALHRP